MKILHHNDLDGRASAAIVLLSFPDAACIEVDYATEIPFDRIERGEDVFVVDFSLREDDWQALWQITTKIVWIDHHETSIEKARNIALDCSLATVYRLSGARSTSRCGAYLTWDYLRGPEPVPPVVRLIDMWDRWVHEDDPEVLDFIAALESHDLYPEHKTWQILLVESPAFWIVEMREEGAIIRQALGVLNARAVKRFAYPMEWEGYRCIVLHTDKSGSKQFDSVKGQYDLMVPVNFDGKKYTVHLYSDTIKVNDIALKYGGGGHPKAAGFVCEVLPWQNPK
jgi:oligoribonuclease NrnB/cAMP/cGMP phosphodiesterase (DHH superfamily)